MKAKTQDGIAAQEFIGDSAVATILFFASRIVVTNFSDEKFCSLTIVVFTFTIELFRETEGVVINTPHGSI